ncbi:hypothetical protein [Brachybacterium hainanense]|uniref:Uncharacterized protein n=1 Tax=Brachybacterium hainanense TaxID=1541174 RepID=A0ABV6R963_9MICO
MDLFGTPEGKRTVREEWRLVIVTPLYKDIRGVFPDRESAEVRATQYAPWVRRHIERRTVTTYETPWETP